MKKLLTLLLLIAVTTLTLGAIEFNKTAEYIANTYSKFLVKSDNNIYQLTDIGLLKSTNNGMSWINIDSDLKLNKVTDFEVGSTGELLVVQEGKVMLSADDGFTWVDITKELSNTTVTNLEVMTSGMILAATSNGAFKWSSKSSSWSKLNLNGQSSSDAILAIGEDAQGNLLVSGSNSGISISNDGGLNFSALDLGVSIGGAITSITAIELDGAGNVWLGNADGALMTLNKITLKLDEVLNSSVIADAIVDIESNSSLGILVSTKNKGIYSSTDGTNFTKIQGSGNLVTNLEITKNNKLLLIDENGLSLGENANSLTKLNLNYDGSSIIAFSSDGDNKIAVTSKGTLSGNAEGYFRIGDINDEEMVINNLKVMGSISIAATNKGVYKLTNSTGVWTELVSEIETGVASEIEVSAEGKILIGTENGLLISENSSFSNYEIVDFTGLLDLDTKVTSVDVASNGRISVTNNTLLYISDDEGETFEALDLGLSLSLIGSIKWDSQGNVYLGTNSNGLFKSTNNGQTFTKLSGVLDNENIINIETQGNKLFVQTDNAFMVSQNGGVTFENATEELNISSITSFELASNNRIELLTNKGLYTSEDGGETFTKEELMINIGTMTDIASNSSGEFILSTMSNGLFKSDDNGQTWYNLSTELEAITITSLEVDATNDNKFYLGTTNGLMVSFNGGDSFQMFSDNLIYGENIISLEKSADNRLMVKYGEESKLALINSNDDLFLISVNGNIEGIITANALGSYISVSTETGLFVSIDGGVKFQEVEGEGSETEISGILDFATTTNGLVLATKNKIWLNADSETTDVTGNLGLNSIVRLETTNNGGLIVLGDSKLKLSKSNDLSVFSDLNGNIGSSNNVFNFDISNDGSLLLSTKNGLFSGSIDNDNREEIKVDLTDINFSEIAIISETEILASSEGGLFISEDFGNSFNKILLEGRFILDAAVNNSNEIFVATRDNGFLKISQTGQILADLSAEFNGEVVNKVESDGEATIIASSETLVKRSKDAGATWSNIEGNINSMSEVIADAEGNLLIVTNEGTTFMLSTTTSVISEVNYQGIVDDITGFGTDLAGNIFISSSTSGVMSSQNNGLTFVEANNGLTTNAIIDLTSSESGNVYALTSQAIFQFDSKTNVWAKVLDDTQGNFSNATDLKAFMGPVMTSIAGIDDPNNDVLVMSTQRGIFYTQALNPTSVGELADRVINIYPNPSNSLNNLTLTMDESAIADLNIYNSNGQKVASIGNLSLNSGMNRVELQLNNVVNGTYFIELRLDKVTLTKQLVIVK
ncbi:MAG: hypothetical protein CVV25_07435 [Ignavibacteriae bacterium HGW-Ignavibacteriae-4]|jgi:ligand-binding sensor domain-containing protein|nr:MAG: hypothetical protein CVV25_07435 [Ignavibacteriae bacterium HGW-Ignavibacteriae-4]